MKPTHFYWAITRKPTHRIVTLIRIFSLFYVIVQFFLIVQEFFELSFFKPQDLINKIQRRKNINLHMIYFLSYSPFRLNCRNTKISPQFSIFLCRTRPFAVVKHWFFFLSHESPAWQNQNGCKLLIFCSFYYYAVFWHKLKGLIFSECSQNISYYLPILYES